MTGDPKGTFDKNDGTFRLPLSANVDVFDFRQKIPLKCEAAAPYATPSPRWVADPPSVLNGEITVQVPEEAMRTINDTNDVFANQICISVNDEPRCFVFLISPPTWGPNEATCGPD